MPLHATSLVSSLLALVLVFANNLYAQCATSWQPGDAIPGVAGQVSTTMFWDPDGSGPMYEVLIVAGAFSAVADIEVQGLAVYDPYLNTWSTLGSGVIGLGSGVLGVVNALATTANGDLVIGGNFQSVDGVPANGLAVWDGTTWTSINTTPYSAYFTVDTIATLPSGDIVAGGTFYTIGGVSAYNVARWNGSSWSPMGTNEFQSRDVFALHTRTNGDLVAGAEGGAYSWNGTAWTRFGQAAGVLAGNADVYTFAELPNGDLLAAGGFDVINGVFVDHVARWDGTNWSTYVPGVPHFLIYSVLLLPNGDLMVGGSLATYPGGDSMVSIWNGTSWQSVGNGLRDIVGAPTGKIVDLALLPTGIVLAGGTLQDERIGAWGLAAWNTASWSPVVGGTAGTFYAAELDANGDLFVCGNFWSVGGTGARNVASWDGSTWTARNSELNQYERTECMIRLSNGDIIVGGNFAELGGVVTNGVARWDGTSWSSVGNGINGTVLNMVPLQDGQFVAIGGFSSAGNVPARNVALWDGTDWKPLGDGITSGQVSCVAALPTGEIVVGGHLSTVGGLPANNLAIYNGVDWTPFGSGSNSTVRTLTSLANGDLIATGSFTMMDGVNAFRVARYDGTTWAPLGSGLDPFTNDVLELPNGDILFGGSTDSPATGVGFYAQGVARWDGNAWSDVDGGLRGYVRGLAFLRGELLALGNQTGAGSNFSSGISRLTSSCPATVASVASGCSGGGSVVMATDGLPWVGASFDYRTTGLPANSVAIEVLGLTAISQPLSTLLPQGQPGCFLLVNATTTVLRVPQASSIEASLALPNTVALAGVSLLQQTVPIAFDTSGNIVAVTSSNALQLTIGSF
jgi:trimeric autotransporter adhesin